MGLIRLPSISQYWIGDPGQDFFRKTLNVSRNRYFSHWWDASKSPILKVTRKTSEGRWATIQSGRFEHIKNRCRSLFNPDQRTNQHRWAHAPIQRRPPLKQYIRWKPNPYGFKLWAFADSDTGYQVDFNVYFGFSGKTEAGLTPEVALDLIDPGPGQRLVLVTSSVWITNIL